MRSKESRSIVPKFRQNRKESRGFAIHRIAAAKSLGKKADPRSLCQCPPKAQGVADNAHDIRGHCRYGPYRG